MKRVSVTSGNNFAVYVPVVLLTSSGREMPNMALLDINLAKIYGGCISYDAEVSKYNNNIVLSMATETLECGVYNIRVAGTYDGRAVELVLASKLAIVADDAQSNWMDMLTDGKLYLEDSMYVAGAYVSDAELERLKEEAREAKASAEEAEAEAREAEAEAREISARAIAMLEGDIAQQATSDDILQAVNGISTTMYKGVLNVAQSANIVTIAPNNRNIWQSVDGELAVTLAGALAGIVNEYILTFVVGDGFSLSIVTDAEIKWFGGDVPTWELGKTYEISIVVENDKALILWAKF